MEHQPPRSTEVAGSPQADAQPDPATPEADHSRYTISDEQAGQANAAADETAQGVNRVLTDRPRHHDSEVD